MIRKLLLTTLFVFAGFILVNAQCTPNVSCLKGVCPDTITNLPTAHVNVVYGTTLTVVVPADTVYLAQTVPIDSLNYTSTTGLPAGFTVTPDKTGWLGGATGCVFITGTPTIAMQGTTYKLVITTTAHGKYMTIPVSIPLTLNGYKIFVKDTVLGINELQDQNGVSFITSMDISGNSMNINIHSIAQMKNATVVIHDITGREMARFSNISGNDYFINENGLSEGIYIISLIEKETLVAKNKMVIR